MHFYMHLTPLKPTVSMGLVQGYLKWWQTFCHRRLPPSSTKAFKRLHSRLILRQQKYFPYIRVDRNLTQQIIDPFLFCQQYRRSSKNSCQTAFIKLIEQWMSCIDKGDIVGTLFLDLRPNRPFYSYKETFNL